MSKENMRQSHLLELEDLADQELRAGNLSQCEVLYQELIVGLQRQRQSSDEDLGRAYAKIGVLLEAQGKHPKGFRALAEFLLKKR